MGEEKSEEEIAKGFRASMDKRGIKDTRAHLNYLRDQKMKKVEANLARLRDVTKEIKVIDRMLEGVI